MAGILCGQEWFEKHKDDYTREDIEAQTLTIKQGESEITVKNKMQAIGIVKEKMKNAGGNHGES